MTQQAEPPPSQRPVLLVVNALVAAAEYDLAPPAERVSPAGPVSAQLLRMPCDVLDWGDVHRSRWAGALARLVGMPLALALLTVARMGRYQVVHVDADNSGLVVALLARLRRRSPLRRRAPLPGPARQGPRLYVVAHRPSGRAQSLALRLGAARGVDGFFVFGTLVGRELEARGVPAAAVHLLPVPIDTAFWSAQTAGPLPPADPPYVCSAGLEFRDYPTLVRASAGLGVELRVAAASYYSRRHNTLHDVDLPPHVVPVDCDRVGLRALYARSELVVVPLDDVEFPAGLTTISEAMSMGKCVVVTRSQGQAEAVADRRGVLRADPSRATRGGLVSALLGPAAQDLAGPTGMYVSVADPQDLHAVLRYLLDHPEVRRELGDRGREVARRVFDVDYCARRMASIMLPGPA